MWNPVKIKARYVIMDRYIVHLHHAHRVRSIAFSVTTTVTAATRVGGATLSE